MRYKGEEISLTPKDGDYPSGRQLYREGWRHEEHMEENKQEVETVSDLMF